LGRISIRNTGEIFSSVDFLSSRGIRVFREAPYNNSRLFGDGDDDDDDDALGGSWSRYRRRHHIGGVEAMGMSSALNYMVYAIKSYISVCRHECLSMPLSHEAPHTLKLPNGLDSIARTLISRSKWCRLGSITLYIRDKCRNMA
jgi:hypothetical protein